MKRNIKNIKKLDLLKKDLSELQRMSNENMNKIDSIILKFEEIVRNIKGVTMEQDIEILEDYIELIKKGYCEDCNELCNIYGAPTYPAKKISEATEHLIKAYKQLVDISIETAFDDTNKDTELLCRVLLNQKQITIENGMYHRENFDWEKHLKMLGLEEVREKNFFLQDSQIDEYTKQLEYKIKELEEENTSKQKAYDDCYCEFKHYKQYESIPVSLVEEKIEALNKKEKQELKGLKGQDRYFVKQMYQYKRNILQELLEKRK